MSEIRWVVDDLLVEKLDFLKKSLKLKSRTKVLEYLTTSKYDNEKEAETRGKK